MSAKVPSSQHVESEGILHGLPVLPKTSDSGKLTALVLGATGVSGYHMVKVLTSSPRWSRIYALSSRPASESFFNDLGDGAKRVEHMQVDLLSEPSNIADVLKDKVEHVDYIFFFSYIHQPPKGNSQSMWMNLEDMARVNVSLLENLLAALKQSSLTPRRFMLQTGAKHYGFYLGPTVLPAYESDLRVLLDEGNFYYKQEDALMKYCQSAGSEWVISRPCYIIGAVPDGSLNHLLGIGIYVAVQAYLKQPFAYPGDYQAWDREQVQTTALLNAHFEEWLALAENTTNEAFNIHDGVSFTWGRLWPYVSQWYGVEWEPPVLDESKYRVASLQSSQTPRGFGPPALLRSTFSLLEWSERPEVEKAWSGLARQHGLLLDPFDEHHRARIFSFADSAVIGNAPMTMSISKAREYGFFGTVDSYRAIFDAFQDMGRLKLIPPPIVDDFAM